MKNASLSIAAAAVLFATAGVAGRLAPPGFTAAHLGLSRLLVGGSLIALLAGPARVRTVLASLPRGSLAAAALALALFQWSFFAAIGAAGVAVGTLVGAGASPMLAEGIEAWRARRMPPKASLASAGLTIAAVGMMAISSRGAGIALALTAALSFATYASIARRLERASAGAGLVTSSIALVAAGLFLLPAASRNAAVLATPAGLAVVAWLALATTVVAYRLFVPALRHVPAAHALAILQLQPLASVIAGGLFLGERVDALVLGGTALMGLALALRAFPRFPSPKGGPRGHNA